MACWEGLGVGVRRVRQANLLDVETDQDEGRGGAPGSPEVAITCYFCSLHSGIGIPRPTYRRRVGASAGSRAIIGAATGRFRRRE